MTREEVIIQFMADSSRLPGGLAAVKAQTESATDALVRTEIAKQKTAANEYIAIWTAAQKERVYSMTLGEAQLQRELTAIDAVAAEKRTALLAGIQAKGFAQARQMAANEMIAQGSIPANLAGGAARQAELNALSGFEQGATQTAGGYIFSKAGKLIGKRGVGGEAVKIGEEAVEGAAHHGTGTAIKREALVLVRETLRGAAISRIASSAMRLISLAGDSILGLALTYVAIPGAIAAAFFEGLPKLVDKVFSPTSFIGKNYGTSVGDYLEARKDEKAGAADLKTKQKDDAEMLRKRIADMKSKGLLSDSVAAGLTKHLDDAGGSGVMAAFNATNPLMSKLQESNADKKAEANAEELRRKKWADFRQEGGWEQKIQTAKLQQHILEEKSVKSAADLNELEAIRHDIAQDNLDIQKQNTDEAEKQKKMAAETQKIHAEASLEISKVNQKDAESYMPTLQELAGRGVFRGQARRAMIDERVAKRDYEYGNVSGAKSAIADRNAIYDSISGQGVLPERESLRDIKNINDKMQIRLAAMGTAQSPLVIIPALK